MHAIIAGCGRVGSELATNLVRLGHSVAVIDKNPKAFDRLRPGFEGDKFVGFVFDRDVLQEAGIKDATAFASVTSGDNSNIVSARTAKEHYRVPHVVARIYDPRRAQIYRRLGIQTVATVRWTTDQIIRQMLPNEIPVEYSIDNGEVVITSVQAPANVVGKRALELDVKGQRRLIALSRFGIPRIPDQELTIQDEDILHFSVVQDGVSSLPEELEQESEAE